MAKSELSLDKMIPSYGLLKAQSSETEKQIKSLNSKIKELMVKKKITEKEAGGFVATYSVRVSETFNEEQLMDFCRAHKSLIGCIKTKEYIDMDELENLMYEKKIPKKLLLEMDKMRIKKKTEYLNIKAVKE